MDTLVDARPDAPRRLIRAAAALAITLAAVKAYHLGVPRLNAEYFSALVAISYSDAVFAALCWAPMRSLLWLAGGRVLLLRVLSSLFVGFSAL
jgi:hypothetical protein